MKKLLVLSALLGVVFSACKKDGYPVHTFVRAKLNGEVVTFSGLNTATTIAFDKVNILSIIGIDSTANSHDAITININSDAPIVAGTYSDTSTTRATGIYNLADSANRVFETGILKNTPHPFVLQITSLTATEVKGIFEGDFISTSFNKGDTSKYTFTEGEFDVTIQ